MKQRIQDCTICGEFHSGKQRWFLIVEDRWQDKLKILHWDARVAAMPGIHSACGAGHLQQLVVHWMTTGSVDHPFARAAYGLTPQARQRSPRAATEPFESGGLRQIGELTVHRESLRRVLSENPASLNSILDALLSALHRDSPPETPEPDWEDGTARPAAREV
jgi:hypothetical protein